MEPPARTQPKKLTNVYPSERKTQTLVDQRKRAVDEQTASPVRAGKFICHEFWFFERYAGNRL